MRYLLLFSLFFSYGYAEDDFYWPEPNPPYNETESFTKPVKVDKELEKPTEIEPSQNIQNLEKGNLQQDNFNSPLQEKSIPDQPIQELPPQEEPIPDNQVTQAKTEKNPLEPFQIE